MEKRQFELFIWEIVPGIGARDEGGATKEKSRWQIGKWKNSLVETGKRKRDFTFAVGSVTIEEVKWALSDGTVSHW